MLRRVVGAARHKARALLTQRMAERLSAPMRDRLDELVAVGDDQPHSPLHGIKTGTSSPSVGGMKRLLARLESIEATGVLDIDVFSQLTDAHPATTLRLRQFILTRLLTSSDIPWGRSSGLHCRHRISRAPRTRPDSVSTSRKATVSELPN